MVRISSRKDAVCQGPLARLSVLLPLVFILIAGQAEAGTWTQLANPPPDTVQLMLLLSDGTVMASDGGGNGWHRLTPDIHGSYVNGTWSTLAPMHDTRLYVSSAVLRDGRVFVAGGEYGTGGNTAEVYDPVKDSWTKAPPPPAGQQLFYDSISKILPDGNVLIAPVQPASPGGTVIYNANLNTWTVGPALFRGSYQDEASWVKLPDNSILTIDPFGTNSERYIPSLNQWINDGNVPVRVYDDFGFEMGAAFLLPNGKAIFFGATGHTAIYTPSGNTSPGTWSTGPDFPNGQGTPDAAAAMMANGKILCAVSPVPTVDDHFPKPTSFYEYDYVNNSFAQVTAPGGGLTRNISSYGTTMLDLPDGSVLYSEFDTQLYVYLPDGPQLAAGQPTISSITTNSDGSFHLTGTLLNGISEGAAYGDDNQMDSNYPIVRLTDGAGNVYYARTYNWSSTGVMTGNTPVTTEFVLPQILPQGIYSLVVAANGISSAPVSFFAPARLTITVPASALEGSGVLANAGTVWVSSVLPTNLVVSLVSGLPSRITVPATITIPAGQFSNRFDLAVLDNSIADGDELALMTASAQGFFNTSTSILVVDDDTPPVITMQPADLTVAAGGSAVFSVSATGQGPLSYFWRRNGSFIPGATGTNYVTNNVQSADFGSQFSCLVTNIRGSTLSSNGVLTVIVPLANDQCVAAINIPGPNYAVLQSTASATSTGDPTPFCVGGFGRGVWYQYTPISDGRIVVDTLGSDFDTGLGVYTGTCSLLTQIACNDDSLGLTSATTNQVTGGVTYYILAGGYGGATGMLALHLTFTASSGPPEIVTQPASQNVLFGGTATFAVEATGSTPLSYFWKRNGVLITGARGTNYSLANVRLADSGAVFTCVVSNAVGVTESSNAVLTVLLVPPQLVQNGGFETGDFSAWTQSGNLDSTFVTQDTTYLHSGLSGAQLGPANSLGYLAQILPTSPGQAYLLSLWLDCPAAGTPNRFQVTWNGTNLFDRVIAGTLGWTNLQFVVNASAAATTLQIGFRNDPNFFGLDDVSVVPLTPVFQSSVKIGGALHFSWNAVVGVPYQVQYNTELRPTNWVNLGGAIMATNGVMAIEDFIGPDRQRFYRVSAPGSF